MYARLLIGIGMVVETVMVILLLTFKWQVAAIFTNDSVVQNYLATTLLISMVCNFLDSIVTIQIGIVKGLGK